MKFYKNISEEEVFGWLIDPAEFPYLAVFWQPAGRCPSGPIRERQALAIRADGTAKKCPVKLAQVSKGEEIELPILLLPWNWEKDCPFMGD